MSGFQIKDGTGNGRSAQVGSDNHLHTFSNTISQYGYVSSKYSEAYVFSAPLLTVPASEAAVLYILNNSLMNLRLSHFFIGYNGGSTNHNRVANVKIYKTMSAPSANNTAYTGQNNNLSSTKVADVTAYYWNGTGSGMTVASNGTLLASHIVGNGGIILDKRDSIIVSSGQAFGLTVTAEEAGTFTFAINTYFGITDSE